QFSDCFRKMAVLAAESGTAADCLLQRRVHSADQLNRSFRSESASRLALQTDEGGFDGEVFVQFPLLDCCQSTGAGLCRKFIHTLTVGGREFPAKHGASFIRRQRMLVRTHNAIPNACGKRTTCYFAHGSIL